MGEFYYVPAFERPPQEGLPLVPRGWCPRQKLPGVPFSGTTIQGQVEAFHFCLFLPNIQRRDMVVARDPLRNRFLWRVDPLNNGSPITGRAGVGAIFPASLVESDWHLRTRAG